MFDGAGTDGGARFGRICLIEEPEAGPFSDRAGAVLADADAVLYERALEPLIAQLLPAGGYAELLPAGAEEEALGRALKLAADGWRVVQLVRPGHGWRRRVCIAAAGLGGDPARHLWDAAADEPLALVVGPIGGAPAAAHAFAAMNGLAG
jgi:hypothetical protein